ncbi:MAG: hypothetical protein A2805_03615 [Candidatus Andersenbacteria bacterium RIFCSPHIGHO2_01_FULL_46_36]|uniref:Uncharacterized protein n=1 Tax=Candidatus Andersenbacteria bacterium RIFCSPHIGHO2_12_FULL_45_11 TaxID=1797281 RepID=A0A1G1X4X5_9BACT|nr:MAG: hypothetical protein A2805_03615 [Candidatus Andersenbacteria bacterium RIFCSPHIGHO2_01_FULL_46_36]OGY35058.1 MAG: hypothetical protein A3D99_00780 [Candidatus Andersenbacteria bacterium RIFCSPHIGHO2_12_FULL_45_11]
MNKGNIAKTILFFFLPLIVLAWTSSALLTVYTLHVALLFVLISIALGFVTPRQAQGEKLALFKNVVHTLMILFLVGGTGWFLSPFFFLLYLLPIYLGFLYTPAVAFGFLAALLAIFASSVGEVDLSFDVFTLLSLLLVIPLLIYLRKKYLILRQTNKDILILQEESGIADSDTIGSLLSNRVTKLGVTVRQPLSFISQAATVLLEEDLSPKEATQYIKRIKTTATETLDYIRDFEGDTSANEVLKNAVPTIETKQIKTIKKPT